MMQAVGPTLNVLSKVIPELIKEKDPLKQGYYVCDSAYKFAVQQVLKQAQEDNKLEGIDLRPINAMDNFFDRSKLEDIDMSGFTLQGALSHPFTNYADTKLQEIAQANYIKQTEIDRLIPDIHSYFLRNLRLILTDAKTADKVEGFRNLMILDNSQLQLQEVLETVCKEKIKKLGGTDLWL